MSPTEYVLPNFSPDAFAGTAEHYLRHRVPYPAAMLRDLLARVGVTGGGRLLDLACGPGRVALALAGSFREVLAVDLEPEMVEVGRREAARRGIGNVAWAVGRAEDLEVEPGSLELVTVGEAFHRLDQQRVAARALGWLRPGGCLVTLGGDGLTEGGEAWQLLAAEVVRRWTRPTVPAAAPPRPGSGPAHNELVLRDAGFTEVSSYDFVGPHVWTADSIVGYLFSTSFCSRRVLGERADAFEADLRAALLAHDPSGIYREQLHFGYTLGRRPG